MNFFPAFVPPTSGGELRYYNLYRDLSEYYDITLLSPTYSTHEEESFEHTETFREYRIPKEEIHDYLHMAIDKEEISTEISALVCALSAKYPNKYHEIYMELYPDSDIIIHESPYMFEYDLFFGFDDKPRIYNSYNFETSLIRQVWSGVNSLKYLKLISDFEKRLVLKSDLVFATSTEERASFVREFHVDREKVKIAPNGINPDELKFKRQWGKSTRKRCFFIGSAHPPNLEAVQFIIRELSKKCPEVDFYIAGSCCEKFQAIETSTVSLLGRIDEDQKRDLFRSADIAINPMFSGAGTNLKTLEFLSSGIPLVSTRIGVRGLELVEGKHFILAEKDDFAEKLNGILGKEELLRDISSKGMRLVDSHYSWAVIAEKVRLELERLTVKRNKKAILLLNDFEVSNPLSGGEVRINKLYTCLSEYYRIILLCLNNDGIIRHTIISDDFLEISFPKTSQHLKEELKQNTKFWISVTDIVNSELCVKNGLLVGAVGCVGPGANAVIFSHPYLAPLAETFENENMIYEALNCEYGHKQMLLDGHPNFENLISQVKDIETRIAARSRFIISVSIDDHECLRNLVPAWKEIVTIQNGVDLKKENLGRKYHSVKTAFGGHPTILFVGSGHKPNIEALNFIIDSLAPELKHCYFVIIGRVCDVFLRQVPKNVLLFGTLREEYKDVLFRTADVAINPMFSGSGSNLKLAEYFANRIPAVTTPFGARGYSIQDCREAVLSDKDGFAGAILGVLNDGILKERLTEKAFLHVENSLEWEILAKRFEYILETRLPTPGKKRLLIVTYRFTEPPLGGAELYLSNVIRSLRKFNDFHIDVATLNIYDIRNKFHFSCDYTDDSDSDYSFNGENLSVWKFEPDQLPENKKYQNAKSLYRTWMSEFVESSVRHLGQYAEPILMGGWHFPEKINDQIEIWSSGEALIYLEGVLDVVISCYSPKRRKLRIYVDDGMVFYKRVKGYLDIDVSIKHGKVLRLVIDPISIEHLDPRPLGLRVSRIRCRSGAVKKELRLDYNYRDFLKKEFPDQYVEEMIRIARKRDRTVDDLFQETRGPNSCAMEKWLDENVKNYDLVLGHSVPFKTSVVAVKHAKKHNKPVVILPHFHFEDEFYHWNSYFQALQSADGVIAFPKVSIKSFYEKIHARTCYAPGGGVFTKEFEDVDGSSFKKLYPSSLPFFLVLGRKSGAKNYNYVIDAAKMVIHQKKRCNVVIIGRDEDGIPISESDAIYLGEQPREVVLGALKECLCLVNMSESESFGIVLLEAWMSKKPVIVNARCRAFLELVEDGVNGIVTDRDGLSGSMTKLFQNRAYAQDLGASGFNLCTQKYTWESIGKKINELLLNLVK